MNRLMATVCMAVVALGSVGCVSQSQFDHLQKKFRTSQAQVIDLKVRVEEANLVHDQLSKTIRNDPQLVAQLDELTGQNTALRGKLTEVEKKLAETGTSVLDPELDRTLAQFVEKNPELMGYDAKRGMVKFRSELTFALGSVAMKPAAAARLAELAQILNTPLASQYEVRIVGHTDNVRISRSATRKNHPTNWHLSVHRAIAVKDVLGRAGVDEQRMGVQGYGEHRPVALNQVDRGNEINRRVEIYLMPHTYKPPVSGGEAAPPEPQIPSAESAEPVSRPASDTDLPPDVAK